MDISTNTKAIQVDMINKPTQGNMINSTTTNTTGNILKPKNNHLLMQQVLTQKLNLPQTPIKLNSRR